MSAPTSRSAFGLILLVVAFSTWERPALAQASFNKIADLPAIIRNVQGSMVEGPDQMSYGVSASGGSTCDCGTVHRIDRLGVVHVIYAFGGFDGSFPNAPLTPDGVGGFLGTTRYGGAFGSGVVFRIGPDGRYTVLRSLNNRANAREGANPFAGLVRVGDRFFGVASVGGRTGYGTIFSLSLDGTFAVEYHLDDARGDGRYPIATLVYAHQRLFGTTSSGGPFGNATLFSFDPSTRVYAIEWAFAGFNGSHYPEGRNLRSRMVTASDGNLWGSTVQGGRSDGGTIFVFDPVTRRLVSIYHLAPYNGRRYPDGFFVQGLTEANDGDLWGVASGGGEFSGGVVFRMSLQGAYTVVHSFRNDLGEGVSPVGELTQMSDGRLNGVTRLGWPGGFGTLFAIYP